jgi:hypothetical protein
LFLAFEDRVQAFQDEPPAYILNAAGMAGKGLGNLPIRPRRPGHIGRQQNVGMLDVVGRALPFMTITSRQVRSAIVSRTTYFFCITVLSPPSNHP